MIEDGFDLYDPELRTENDPEEGSVEHQPENGVSGLRPPPKISTKVRSLRSLLEDPSLLKPPTPLIQDIAYSGRTTLLAGQDKAGKSTLMTQAVAALTSGGEFFGRRLDTATVLWLALDESLGDFVRRAGFFGAGEDALFVMEEAPSTVQEFGDVLEYIKPSLVVVDVLARWWLGQVMRENDSMEVGAFLGPRIREARDQKCALVLLHHTDKAGGYYRGSSDIGAQVDIRGILRARGARQEKPGEEQEPIEDDGRRTLSVIGRAGVRANLSLTFDGVRYAVGDAPLPLDLLILRKLEVAPASATELTEMLHKRKGDVLECVRTLRSEGFVMEAKSRVSITDSGRYHLSQPQPSRTGTEPVGNRQ